MPTSLVVFLCLQCASMLIGVGLAIGYRREYEEEWWPRWAQFLLIVCLWDVLALFYGAILLWEVLMAKPAIGNRWGHLVDLWDYFVLQHRFYHRMTPDNVAFMLRWYNSKANRATTKAQAPYRRNFAAMALRAHRRRQQAPPVSPITLALYETYLPL